MPATVPTGYRCELQAYDTRQYYGEVHGNGFNHCTHGVRMKSQACIYKLHHIFFVGQYRREACNPTNLGIADRPPAFRPVSVSLFRGAIHLFIDLGGRSDPNKLVEITRKLHVTRRRC
ncbi:MAG: hypothetical protein M3Y17_10070 [Actinomycetota bacterium]|nr:hypothetical protein [Actinomycetota bacterium]